MNALKLYTLKGWIFWYVNYISIKIILKIETPPSECVCVYKSNPSLTPCTYINEPEIPCNNGHVSRRIHEWIPSHFRSERIFFKNIFYWLCYYSCPISPLYSPPPCTPPPTRIPPSPYFMSMGHTYKVLGFSISHTILTLPVYFLPTIYATYSLCLSPLSPPPAPLLVILHVISISVVLFLF